MAFNVDPNLSHFDHIVPCGIRDLEVTSLRKEVALAVVDVSGVTEDLIHCLATQLAAVDVGSYLEFLRSCQFVCDISESTRRRCRRVRYLRVK